MIGAVAAGLALLAVVAHGTWHRNSPVFGRALGRLPTRARVVSLTFDDGPNPQATPAILDALAAANVKATFFLLGRHVERWPAIAARVAREGHQIGNHGYWHRKLHRRTPAYVHDDLSRGLAAIKAATGVTPTVFRAPHGFRNPWVSPIASSLGERTIGWSLGVWDSDRPGVDAIVARTLEGTRPGSILLLHDGDGYDPDGDRMQTARAVPRIISELRAQGYSFTTLPTA